MRKRNLILLLMLSAFVFSISIIQNLRNNNIREHKTSNEERPDQPALAGKEKELFDEYLNRRLLESNKKASSGSTQSTYANGKLSGQWSTKIPRSAYYGYRVDNSAYDSLRNVFYVVTYAGHLYKLEYENELKWTLLNHKIQLNPPDNGSANPVFMGTLLPDSTFRLIRSYDEANRMEYSDDEGRTWIPASGAKVTRSWSNQAFEITNNGLKRIVLHTYDSDYHHIYFSDDQGASYTESSYSFRISSSDIRIAKPFYTNDAYMWVWSKISREIDIYKYDPATNDFILKTNSGSTLQGTNLSSAAASYFDGKYHFYLSTINSEYTVYYSSDEGTTWQQKNAGRDKPFEVMCPDKPNILISGFEDMKISTNYGTSWTGYDYKLGWDLQHMRTYEKSGGTPITLAGLDFGCYISETPENKDSYTWCNVGASYVMHYDAATSENFSSIYMANQDRGTTAYADAGDNVNTVDVDGTDVLRVCFSNHEISTWSWFYYGRIKHRYNFPTGKSGDAVYDGLGNWWAAPIIASPNPSEDAIYAAYGSNLHKFSYKAENNTIEHITHPFDFKEEFGFELGGFGYSGLNPDLWYAALLNGTFLYSRDGGNTWNKFSYIGLMPKANDQDYNFPKNQIVIKASSIDTNKVFYAGVGNYLLVSEDGGKRFQVKNRGLNVYRIRDFDLSPDEKFIFAACGYGGAWIYSVEDDYWYQMSDDPIPSVDFTDVQFIRRKNCVRFSTYGSGILDFTLSKSFTPVNTPDNLHASYNSGLSVELSWADESSNEEGFYIERADTGSFFCIDTLTADATAYSDTGIEYAKTYYYRVRAFKDDSSSYVSNLAFLNVPVKGFLYYGDWEIESASSQEINADYLPAKYAIDNNPATFWHTEWKNALPSHPHYIVIDLGSEVTIAGLRYLPRQDGNTNGSVALYEIFVSGDPENWGTAVSSGQFNSTKEWKEDIFNEPTTGRYVKFVALSEINGSVYASAAEITLLYEALVPDAPTGLTATVNQETNVRLRWTDNAINESGYILEQLVDGNYIVIDSLSSAYTQYLLRDLEPVSTYEFRIKAYNAAGESEATESVQITTEGTSIGVEVMFGEMKMYPIPCTSQLNIEFPVKSQDAIIKIINLRGQTVFAKRIEDGYASINLPVDQIPNGYYIVEVISGNKRFSQKIRKL